MWTVHDSRGFHCWMLACPLEPSIGDNGLTSHLFLSLHRDKVPPHDSTVRLQRRSRLYTTSPRQKMQTDRLGGPPDSRCSSPPTLLKNSCRQGSCLYSMKDHANCAGDDHITTDIRWPDGCLLKKYKQKKISWKLVRSETNPHKDCDRLQQYVLQ